MAMQTDPVCGMKVDDQLADSKSQYQGKTYYFCSDECKRKFDQKPESYVGKKGQAQGSGKAHGGGGKR
jgi:YHS domain-containing protein